MKEGFEQKFQKFQTDMIQICLENVQHRTDAVYIYCYAKEGRVFCNHFYKVHGKPVKKHLLNTVLLPGEPAFDVSVQRQKMVNSVLVEDLNGMVKVCKEYEHPMPTEIKLICTLHRSKGTIKYAVKVDYNYENNQPEGMTANEWSEAWFKKAAM